MSTPDVRSILGAILGGLFFVILPFWISATAFSTPSVPLIGMVAGFLLMGIVTGYFSTQETVAEPYMGAIVTSVIAYVVFAPMELPSLQGLDDGQFQPLFILTCINGLVATFAGAWTGEKLQRTYAQPGASHLAWGWVMAGTVLGVGTVLFLVSVLVSIFGFSSGTGTLLAQTKIWTLALALAFGTGFAGFFSALRSPGDTANETILSGLVTATLVFDLFYFGLGGEEVVSSLGLAAAVGIGLVASLLGGLFGEEMQNHMEQAATAQQPAGASPTTHPSPKEVQERSSVEM